MEVGVGRLPNMVKWNLQIVSTFLESPRAIDVLNPEAHILTSVPHQEGHRLVQQSAIVTSLALGHEGQGGHIVG